MILRLVAVSIISGGMISIAGYCTPFVIVPSIFMSIGACLLSTLQTGSGHSMRISYNIIFNFIVDIGLQKSLLAARAVLGLQDSGEGRASRILSQPISGSIFISAGQNIFTNRLPPVYNRR
jgi:hypothetical protein